MKETAVQSTAIFLIDDAAAVFVNLVALTGLTRSLVELINYLDMSTAGVILTMICVYLLLGMFLDPIGAKVVLPPPKTIAADRAAIRDAILDVANGPGEKILSGVLAKGLKILN